jgi:hypothetical protein
LVHYDELAVAIVQVFCPLSGLELVQTLEHADPGRRTLSSIPDLAYLSDSIDKQSSRDIGRQQLRNL